MNMRLAQQSMQELTCLMVCKVLDVEGSVNENGVRMVL